jgi:release factor glutamine methyltransferase
MNQSRSDIVSRLRSAGCVFAEDEAALLIGAAPTAADLEWMVRDRVSGRPIEQVVGWAEFCGLRIEVDNGVFVPRRRTEFLVEIAAGLCQPATIVIDMCCGSGAVGVALVAFVGDIELHASDVDAAAVHCARRNVATVGGTVYAGDLFDPLPGRLRGNAGLVLVNAPYVPSDAIALLPHEARDHEPRVTLDGGPDGLDVHRRIANVAPQWLEPGGSLLIEVSDEQATASAALFEHGGLVTRVESSDDLEATVVIGVRPFPPQFRERFRPA